VPFFKNLNIKNILQRSTKTLQSFSSYITIGAVVKQVLYIRTLNMSVKYVLCLPLANANLANVLIFYGVLTLGSSVRICTLIFTVYQVKLFVHSTQVRNQIPLKLHTSLWSRKHKQSLIYERILCVCLSFNTLLFYKCCQILI
jgi:hypothetical protein